MRCILLPCRRARMEFPAANGNSVDGPGPSSAADRPSIGIMNDMDIFYGGSRGC